mmetsp:Transcript_84300/g.161171  ORF Transcript_84300/g.161171 Transcript_84300/m.161171 type:complete len:340 (-) Transcript_84300:211-1230(-)
MLTRQYLLALFCIPNGLAVWPDCGEVDVTHDGPFGEMVQFNATAEDGTLVFVYHPAKRSQQTYPVMVYSHGATGEYPMYIWALRRYVSHGFVVIGPHIKSPQKDTSPFTLDPHGNFTIKGVHYAVQAASDISSPLYQMLDLKNLVLAGHSMGATSTIMAAAKLPVGTSKVAIAQHPGLCGPWGPPPCIGPGPLCNTWMPADFKTASSHMPVLLMTATNDAAFWPAPHTAEHEAGCYEKSRSEAYTAFVQFSADACADDGTGGRYDRKWSTGGHDCPMRKVSPETQWVLVAAKLYAQLGGNSSSYCHSMLWGTARASIKADPAVEKVIINTGHSSSSVVV